MVNYRNEIDQVLAITKALSDINRLRAFMMLYAGELCVCQLIELLGLAPSTVSKHLSILTNAGLISSRKSGRWIYYRLNENFPHTKSTLRWLFDTLRDDEVAAADFERLKEIKQMDRDALCECYKVASSSSNNAEETVNNHNNRNYLSKMHSD